MDQIGENMNILDRVIVFLYLLLLLNSERTPV